MPFHLSKTSRHSHGTVDSNTDRHIDGFAGDWSHEKMKLVFFIEFISLTSRAEASSTILALRRFLCFPF